MKKIKNAVIAFMALTMLACNTDDPASSSIQEQQNKAIAILTNGTGKVWKIIKAELTSTNGTVEITDNFNVHDDEFLFSEGSGNKFLKWKRGYDINASATTAQEALTDQYAAPVDVSLSFDATNELSLIADNGLLSLTVQSENTVTGTIKNDEGTIVFTLAPKLERDYVAPGTTSLQFEEAFTFESNAVNGYAPGMVGSYRENSLFIATREDALAIGPIIPERIIKYDLQSETKKEFIFQQSDLVSKELQMIDDQLVVIGGRFINFYDTDISTEPTSVEHSTVVTRHGSSIQGSNIFIVGGTLNSVDGTPFDRDKIMRWSTEDQNLMEFATMPETRSGARGTIVHDNMYIFGGSEEFYSNPAKSTIFIIPMDNPGNVQTAQMSRAVNFTFVERYEHLIYVAGKIDVYDSNNALIGHDAFIGVFNTRDDSFIELSHNLENSNGLYTIHQMCLLNDKMYIIYGDKGENIAGGTLPRWTVMAANIN